MAGLGGDNEVSDVQYFKLLKKYGDSRWNKGFSNFLRPTVLEICVFLRSLEAKKMQNHPFLEYPGALGGFCKNDHENHFNSLIWGPFNQKSYDFFKNLILTSQLPSHTPCYL